MTRIAVFLDYQNAYHVLMAIDIALGARDDRYDVAVIVSADTDLVPAIEVALDAGRRVETATWVGSASRQWPLRVPTHRLWNHQLDERRFGYVRDDTNYLAS
ncbi:MAG: NYN domain-containing protein [bacterium]|nr:NYN domain-containing protein [bacterium]